MRVELLLSPDCPHADTARAVLACCLDQVGLDMAVTERVGDYPSPTVLVDDIDVMSGIAGVPAMQACRLDWPTEAKLLAALRAAANSGSGTEDAYPAQLAVGVTSSRIAEVTPAARRVHRAILAAFATTGHAPDRAALSAAVDGGDLSVLLAELHEHDVVRLDDAGGVRGAYPFSGIPTAHAVAIDGGPSVYAMCAIDALGVADMLCRDVTITSADPGTGDAITVTIRKGHATWVPDSAVVYVGSTQPADNGYCPPADGTGVVAAADRCCGVMNFFTSPATAQRWVSEHPGVCGVVLTQRQARRLGNDIFGHLLDDAPQ